MSILILVFICFFIGLPVGISLVLRSMVSRQTEEPTLTLHKQRLETLKRERDAGLMEKEPYDAARLETERSILDHSYTPPSLLTGPSRAHWVIGVATLLLIPLLALLLYAINGQPFLGAHPATSVPASAFRSSPLTPPATTSATPAASTPSTTPPPTSSPQGTQP